MNTSERASARVSYTNWKAVQMYVTKLRQKNLPCRTVTATKKGKKTSTLTHEKRSKLTVIN